MIKDKIKDSFKDKEEKIEKNKKIRDAKRDDISKNNRRNEKELPAICKHFLRGVCRHGLLGKIKRRREIAATSTTQKHV